MLFYMNHTNNGIVLKQLNSLANSFKYMWPGMVSLITLFGSLAIVGHFLVFKKQNK